MSRHTKVRRLCLVPAGLMIVMAMALACGDGTAGRATGTTDAGARSGSITVFAAASLADAFEAAGEAFEAANPGTSVTFNFGSSSTLATQVNEAGGADVFASASGSQMKVVTDAGNASNPQVFATNALVVARPKGSTVVTSFADLATPGIRLVLAGPDVPVGQYAREALRKASQPGALGDDFEAKVMANLESEESDTRAALAKAQLGEADAVIVYATDVRAAPDDVDAIEIPDAYNVIATYPIAVTSDAQNRTLARAFVEFVLSDAGRAILARHGFGPPAP